MKKPKGETRFVDFEDERGRKYRSLIPATASDSEAEFGIIIGPPEIVDELDLPEPFATRLHNELFRRHLWDANEIKKQRGAIQGALMSALKVDQFAIARLYQQAEQVDSE